MLILFYQNKLIIWFVMNKLNCLFCDDKIIGSAYLCECDLNVVAC
jgi:hypothetical protein